MPVAFWSLRKREISLSIAPIVEKTICVKESGTRHHIYHHLVKGLRNLRFTTINNTPHRGFDFVKL